MAEGSVVKQSQFRLVQTVNRVSFELECEVTLTEEALCWKWQPPPPDTKHRGDSSQHQPTEKSVRISWVLEPHVYTEKPSDPEDDPVSKIVIHFVKRDKTPPQFNLSIDIVEFYGPKDLCTEWVGSIKDHIETKVPERPQSLLVIINPSSGGKKGEKIFSTDVTPIFDAFKIKTDVKVTKVPADTEAILQDYDLTTVDGLVSVGGDGTHWSVCSALMKKTLQTAEVGEVTPSTQLPKSPVRHGMIPAGTGNGGQMPFSYSKDPITNAIVIALGKSKPQDVYTWHCGEEFIGYFLLGSAFGLLSQSLDAMETNRWAGPGRFVAAMFVALVKHAPVMLSIDYLPAQSDVSTPAENSTTESALGDPSSSPNDPGSAPNDPSSVPNDFSGTKGDATVLPPGWKRITEKILEVDAFCFSDMTKMDLMRCYMSENEAKPGVFSLIITRPCGRMGHLKYMRKCIQGRFDQAIAECDFVECMSVRECRVRVIPDPDHSHPLSRLSLDGEIVSLPQPHFNIQGHAGVIPTFARTDGAELRELCKAAS